MTNCKLVAWAMTVISALFMAPAAFAQEPYNSATIAICAVLKPQPGKETELRNALQALVGPTSKEAGHIAYDIYEEAGRSLFLHEVWRSQEELGAHLQQPYVQDFIKAAPGLLDGENDAHFGTVLSANQGLSAASDSVDLSQVVHICSIEHPREGKTEELRAALMALVEPTRNEEGFMTYNLYQEKNGSLFLYEAWRSQADLEEHFRTPYAQQFRQGVGQLAERNEVHFGKAISLP